MQKQTRIALATATCLGAALLVSSASLAAELEARLDRNQVGPGESVSLTLRLRGDGRGEEPDLRPLRNDFEVLDVATSFRTQIVNGRHDASVDWRITLLPLRTGALEVPSLQVGQQASAPQPLEVLEDTAALAGRGAESSSDPPGRPVFIEAEVDDPNPYVQGGITLTVRLHADDRVLDGALSEPTAGDAIIERVGEDRTYHARVGNRDYAVVERTWSIFPQRSGPLTIEPVQFQGTVREERRRAARDPFAAFFGGPRLGGSLFDDFFGPSGQPVRAHSAPLSLAVRPKPDTAQGQWWVPARDVTLVEQWEQDPPVFRVGEPVNRMVAIRAAGISASQLPALELPEVDGLKQYREPPVEETIAIEDEVIAVKAWETAIIPTQPGELVLPAVELEWWDTAADEPRTARLPSRTIEIAAGHGPATGAATASTPLPIGGGSDTRGTRPGNPQGSAPGTPPTGVANMLHSPLTLASLAAIVLAAGGVLGWTVRRWPSTKAAPATRTAAAGAAAPLAPSMREAEKGLRLACDRNDPAEALTSLRTIGRLNWPQSPPLGAGDWALRLGSDDLTRAVERLQRVRYCPQAAGWSGGPLWQAYSKVRRTKKRTARQRPAPLPGLYPAGPQGEPAA